MKKPKNDPLAELAEGVAADHTLAKAVAAGDGAAAAEEPDDEPAIADNVDPKFIGDFDSFDAVRAFTMEEEKREPSPGDLTVVNGALVRVMPSGTFATVVDSLVDEFGAPGDHVESFSRGLTEIERVVMSAAFSGNSLLGTFVNVLVTMFKSRPKQWSQMSEGEQRDLKKQLEGHGKDLIRKITRVVAEGEEISVAGKLERYTHSGSFDLKITALSDEDAALQLFRMQGHDVLIMSADSKRFLDGDNDALIDPDEPPLPFADGPGSFDDSLDEDEEIEEETVTDDDLDAIADKVVEEQGGAKPIGAAFEASEAKRIAEQKAADGENRKPKADAGTRETVEEPPVIDEQLAEIADDIVTEERVGEAVEVEQSEAETEEVIHDDAEAAENGADDVEQVKAAIADAIENGQLAGEYESRSNPDDADDFVEATPEELAAQKARAQGDTTAAADYVGPREPAAAIPGESWIDTSKDDERPKFKHPNGKWYLGAPDAADVDAWKSENMKPADDDSGFPSVDD